MSAPRSSDPVRGRMVSLSRRERTGVRGNGVTEPSGFIIATKPRKVEGFTGALGSAAAKDGAARSEARRSESGAAAERRADMVAVHRDEDWGSSEARLAGRTKKERPERTPVSVPLPIRSRKPY